MADEVYLEFETIQTITGETEPGKFRVDLAPVDRIEETYQKQPLIDALERESNDGKNPITSIHDTKKTLHNFIFTGTLTPLSGIDIATRRKYLRYLYGYTGGATDTRLALFYNGEMYYGYMTRLSLYQNGGEEILEYMIEIIEGMSYDDVEY